MKTNLTKFLCIPVLLLVSKLLVAQSANLTAWKYNTTGVTYYDPNTSTNIPTDVQEVWYTSSTVYIVSNGIPNYYVVNQTVNDAADQDWVFGIPRNPVEKTGTKTSVGQGQIGVYVDGSCFFHPGDAQSYQNAGKWWRGAYFFEKPDFDYTNGHSTPSPSNTYHHHVANSYYSYSDNTKHSALIGFAWDGFPIYGPYGYTIASDANSGISRMTSSWQERNMSSRTTLPDGSSATGPAINSQYPLGCFIEDYEYKSGTGTLDQYNGRFCVTPEYPNGTYAYFTTINADLTPDYPYFIGKEFYGTVQQGNQGPTGGSFTIPGGATKFTSSGIETNLPEEIKFQLFPNPTSDKVTVALEERAEDNLTVKVYDIRGVEVMSAVIGAGTTEIELSTESLSNGTYLITFDSESKAMFKKLQVQH